MQPRATLPAELRLRPFTLAQAAAVGVSRSTLRHAVVRRVHPGVYAAVGAPDDLAFRARAALLALPPGSALAGLTAVELWGLPLPLERSPAASGEEVVVAVPESRTLPRLHGVDPHHRELTGRTGRLPGTGLPAVHPRHLWADLAAELPFPDAVALGDAVRARWASAGSMEAALGARAGHRGVVAARRVLLAVRYRVDSGMETRVRLVLTARGIPEARYGQDLVVEGQWIARPDFAWREQKVVVEFDGDQHRTDRRQWQADVARRRLLEAAGWRVICVTADDVLRRPDELASLVAAALRERGLVW